MSSISLEEMHLRHLVNCFKTELVVCSRLKKGDSYDL